MTPENAALKYSDQDRPDNLSARPSMDIAQIVSALDSQAADKALSSLESSTVAQVLRTISPDKADQILRDFSPERRAQVEAHIPSTLLHQWKINRSFPEGSIGRLMDPPTAVFPATMTVAETIETLRELVKSEFITYGYIVNDRKELIGVLVMRDLLFAAPHETLEQVMLENPFSLKADMPLMDAMKEVLAKHFPVYPISNAQGELIGLIRGSRLFEAQAVEISAQAGSMVGVEKEERLTTSWFRSFKYRHPWLQLNLFTAFIAGGVVSVFQNTIDEIVVLASFLPVLAGQSGNTGCQSLAVTLRGMTLGELKNHGLRRLLLKEALLGLLNGALVGLSAGIGMYLLAKSQNNPDALPLSLIVVFAMIGSCFISGVSGALVPLGLKKIGADPATASSIFLTTATDVASMGMLLFLATWILL